MDRRNKNIQTSKLCAYDFSLLISSHDRGENRHIWKFGLALALKTKSVLTINWLRK